jgi:hypothetical protein
MPSHPPLADHLDQRAHQLDHLADTLRRTSDTTTWTGTAADAFRQHLAHHLTQLHTTATRLRHAAQHLRANPTHHHTATDELLQLTRHDLAELNHHIHQRP